MSSDDLEELHERPLPWSLAETLRRQVEHLEPAHQRLVEAAAVLGNRVPFDLLAAVSGMAEGDLIWALRELVRQGVLTETGEDEFAFRHALVREAVGERLLGRERRRLHEAALDALLAAGDADWALLTKHAQGAGRYDDMLAAARDGSSAYLAMGSAFQALQLAEIGLEEDSDDLGLLRNAAHAGWLAGLLDDADAYARRWQARQATADDAVAALNLRIRLAYDRGDASAMSALSSELTALVDRLEPGLARARGMAMLALSTRLRDLDDESVRWADRTVELADELGDEPGVEGVRLAALVEKGALLVARAATLEQGRSVLIDVANRAEAAKEWLVAAFALNKLVHLPPATSVRDVADLLERMRASAERAGSEKFAVAAYYQGRARLFMQKGNLAAATDAIERGRAHDPATGGIPPGLPRRVPAGLRLRRATGWRGGHNRRLGRRTRYGDRPTGAAVPHREPAGRRGTRTGAAPRRRRGRPVHGRAGRRIPARPGLRGARGPALERRSGEAHRRAGRPDGRGLLPVPRVGAAGRGAGRPVGRAGALCRRGRLGRSTSRGPWHRPRGSRARPDLSAPRR